MLQRCKHHRLPGLDLAPVLVIAVLVQHRCLERHGVQGIPLALEVARAAGQLEQLLLLDRLDGYNSDTYTSFSSTGPSVRKTSMFSAPNYCDQMGNQGAMLILRPDLDISFKQFTAAPHPSVKPMVYVQSSMFGL